jgi:hypothetical protein
MREHYYDLNWNEWPACDRPGYYGGVDGTWERTRWLAAHRVPFHLMGVFFLDYEDVEDTFSYSSPCYLRGAHGAPRKERVGGWFRRGLAWFVGWFWGWPRRPNPPLTPLTPPPNVRSFEWNTKC